MTTREQIIAAAKDAGFDDRQWEALTYDSGPYEVSTPRNTLERFYAIAFEAGRIAEREECAKNAGEFARKWWSTHCATNRHLETTRAAHDDFCALQIAIRARGESK